MTLAIALVALGLAALALLGVVLTFVRAAQHVYHLQDIVAAHHSVLKIQVHQIQRLEESCRDDKDGAKSHLN